MAGVVSFRFTLCFTETKESKKEDTMEDMEGYDKNSLCSIFEYINRVRMRKKYGK